MTFAYTLTKKEVATLLKISPATLRKWLNERYFNELKELGYTPSQKILTPKQLNFLSEKIDFYIEKQNN